jgi:hypothetical protein
LILGRGRSFSLFCSAQTSSGSHPASYPVDIRLSELWIKHLWLETDNTPSSNAGVRSVLHYSFIPSLCLRGGVFIHMETSTLPYLLSVPQTLL